MQIAQGLYEGVDVGDEGTHGLITYMRTDSTRLSGRRMDQAREYIDRPSARSFMAASIQSFRGGAQDAHEAIRPTRFTARPERLKPFLKRAQLRYTADLGALRRVPDGARDPRSDDRRDRRRWLQLRATGSMLKFAGYTEIYEESPG